MMQHEEMTVAVIGSGFSGLAMAHALKQEGREDFVLLERARDIGGTWRDNSYPGCACDVPSHVYSLSFAPNPDWTTTFAKQNEIHAYLKQVAEDFDLVRHVRFGAEVEQAEWDDEAQRWTIRTSAGTVRAKALVSASGALSEPLIPDIPGLREFPGTVFHSATWDHEHDLTGERVAVIGTGASAIQFVPQIQKVVGQLHLFQRTPPWIMPRPDRRITNLERALYKRVPAAQRVMRGGIAMAREGFVIPFLDIRLSGLIRVLAMRHLKRQVPDPELRAKLTPDYAPGCKRILVSNDYLPSLSEPNVEVITSGIREVRGNVVVGADGTEREVDTIILGTGFHVTDLPIAERIRGRDGVSLAEHWDGSLNALRGTTVAGFPNLFFLLGPNTGTGHTSVILLAEAQVRYVIDALRHVFNGRAGAIEPRPEAQARWNAAIDKRMRGTVWTSGGCASWYLDAKGRNSTLWPGFATAFARAVRRFDLAEYALEPVRVAQPVAVPS